MANQTMTGTTRYPLQTRQQVDVSVPTMDVGKWTPPTYAETPEYAPLGWQMAGVRGSRFGPPTQASVTRGPSDADRQMQRMALEKAALELDAAQAANRPLPSAMRMGPAGQWGMYVDPSQLTAAQQMAGLTGGMYGSPSGGDWRGRATMFGGLSPAQTPMQGPEISGLASLREQQAAADKYLSSVNPNRELYMAQLAAQAAQRKG